MSKCSSCMFRGVFQDHGASCYVCTVQKDLVKAIKAIEDHSSDSPCDYFITSADLIDLLARIKEHRFINVALLKLELKEFLENVYGTDCCSRPGGISSELMKLVDGLPTAKLT